MSTDRPASPVRVISAITLATHDMGRAVRFYEALGFRRAHGGPGAGFTSFALGQGHLNLIAAGPEQRWSWWGRAIFHVDDVDRFHDQAVASGLSPAAAPADAPWGERFFHILDPDGHELSFAEPLRGDATVATAPGTVRPRSGPGR
jgi:catechol 2,3-dioxygenase-like lactoylglutathione lyase family enzyme